MAGGRSRLVRAPSPQKFSSFFNPVRSVYVRVVISVDFRSHIFVAAVATSCVAATAILGCADRSGPYAIAGTVTLDGRPVPQGQIVFDPQGDGKMSVGVVRAGKFSIAAERGPTPGTYIVRITAERPTGQKVKPSSYAADQTPQDVYEQYIPANYNTASELNVEMGADEPEPFSFRLVSG